MNKIKYKFDNRLWELEKSTGMFIDSINNKKVISLCYLCHSPIYQQKKDYISFETERVKVTGDNGEEKVSSKYIHICGECSEH